MKPAILFVCLGNICRSPAAEAVFRTRSSAVCDSAGTSGWHVGDPPYGPMRAVLSGRGYDAGDLRARAFSAADFDRFDLIVGMDARNVEDIERLRRGDTPVRLLTDYVSGADGVPDPYYTGDFEGALDLIERCIDALVTAEKL